MKKTVVFLLSLCMMLSLFAGCGNTQTNTPASDTPETSVSPTTSEGSGEDRVVTITDMSGDEVTIKGEVKEIVNLWPAGTSSFFVMGAGDLISGLATNDPGTMNAWSQFFYPDCVNIPGLGGTSPSVEEIVKLEPDLVIIHPTTAKDGLAEQIRQAGIPAININFSNYEEMIQAYTILGEILGGEYQEKLTTWCNTVQEKITNVRNITANLTEEEKPIVYYIAGQKNTLLGTMAASSSTSTNIMQDWIESAGGRFASKEMNLAANEAVAEEVFSLNPDVIMCCGIYQHQLRHALETTDGWKELNAVKNGRVYNNPYACFNWDRFGMESLLQIDFALLCIQPELAEANGITKDSMIQEIIDFYAYYNGKQMTVEEATNMFNGLQPDGTAEYPVE